MEDEIKNDNTFQNLILQNYKVDVFNINSDEGRQVANLYKVNAVPTIIQYNTENYETKQLKGFGSINKLAGFLNLNYKNPTISKSNSLDIGCGDGIMAYPETCDDGNTNDNDGCSSTCTVESGWFCIGEPSNCTFTVGVIDNEIDETKGQFSNLSIYPNPLTDKIIASFYLLHKSDVEYTIFDIFGKIIDKHTEQNLTFGKNEIVLDNILQKGEYLFQIQVTNHNGSFRQTKKIIKK